MSFFDSIIDTPSYQSQALARQSGGPPSALPQPNMGQMQPTGFAKGGLASANELIKSRQIVKVFEHYFQNLGVDVKKGMMDLQKEIQQGLQLIPFESSVLGYKPLSEGVAQIHFFTVGTLKDLADDMRYFYKYLKEQGVKTVYDTLPAPITTQVLVQLGAKVEQSDNPKYKFKATI
jgi:hypothetical protein